MSSSGSWLPTPRESRRTYASLPSTSVSNFDSPFQRTTQPVQNSKRRRTTATFPAVDQLHSAPTIASSDFTASASNSDISHPTPKLNRFSLQLRTRTPTRIPTPIPYNKVSSSIRSVSSPAAFQRLKENYYPTTHRLLGPIPPGPAPISTLTKSRTMNVLSSLTSSFSRSTRTLTSSRSSYGNLSSQSTQLIATPTTDILHVGSSMPSSYWLGRFQALHDRFRGDYLDSKFLDSPKLRHYWMTIPGDAPDTDAEPSSACKGDERLPKRVFMHLEALCITSDARKSLKAFQQAYARKFASEALLPLGGCMLDAEPSFIAKAGRLFSGGRKSGSEMTRRRSTLSMSFTVDNIGV